MRDEVDALNSAPVHAPLMFFSAISFLGFGLSCFIWPRMQQEYVRYGVSQFRPLVGGLQIAGALGLMAGFAVPVFGQLAAAGLALLMLLGALLRIRIKDNIAQTLPAVFYFVINAYLAVAGF